MILTRRQSQRIKRVLFVIGGIFALQMALPHVTFAAHENYVAFSNGEDRKYAPGIFDAKPLIVSEQEILDRGENLLPERDASAPETFLPLEGDPQVVKEHWLTVTAYSSEPRQTDSTPFTTAWITPVRDGVVALNFLPKGTVVRFPDMFGDKLFVVEDRMNVRYPYRADIWMYERDDARQFGIKYLRMEELSVVLPRNYVLNHFEAAFPGLE